MDMYKMIKVLFAGAMLFFYSCTESGNEPNNPTNTHNTSEPSPSAHTMDIPIDARSIMPADRLNDGNVHAGVWIGTVNEDYAAEAGENQGEVQGNEGEELDSGENLEAEPENE